MQGGVGVSNRVGGPLQEPMPRSQSPAAMRLDHVIYGCGVRKRASCLQMADFLGAYRVWRPTRRVGGERVSS